MTRYLTNEGLQEFAVKMNERQKSFMELKNETTISDDATPCIDFYRYLNTDIWVWHGNYSEIKFTYNDPAIPPKNLANADEFLAVCNAGLPGYVMVDGVVQNPDYSNYRGWGYLFIDDEYNFHAYRGQRTPTELENSVYPQACSCWPPVVENGLVYDYTEFSDWDTYESLIDVNPRTMVGKKDGELYIIYVCGRMYESIGLTYADCGNFAVQVLGLTECYQLDGGGSSMLCVGSQAVGITSEINSSEGRAIISCMTVK